MNDKPGGRSYAQSNTIGYWVADVEKLNLEGINMDSFTGFDGAQIRPIEHSTAG